jgi:hypothetical protein
MKTIHSMIAALGLALVLPAAADAATTDPEVIIYRFPGVADDVAAGFSTVFYCTNFSGATESIRFATRQSNGALLTNFFAFVNHLESLTAATHFTGTLGSQFNLGTGAVRGGTTAIAATSTNIVCTAMTIDAANPKPDGIALRGIRFSPVPGSQE